MFQYDGVLSLLQQSPYSLSIASQLLPLCSTFSSSPLLLSILPLLSFCLPSQSISFLFHICWKHLHLTHYFRSNKSYCCLTLLNRKNHVHMAVCTCSPSTQGEEGGEDRKLGGSLDYMVSPISKGRRKTKKEGRQKAFGYLWWIAISVLKHGLSRHRVKLWIK